MEIEILNTNKEPLMKRTAFEAKVVFQGKTPSRPDMIKSLSQKLNSKDTLTIIKKIATNYGSERAVLNGFIYDDEATMKKLEEQYVMLRHLTTTQQKEEREKIKSAKLAAAPTAGTKKKKK